MRNAYLDHVSGTPLNPQAAEGMKQYMEHSLGNPSSLHTFGELPRWTLEKARERVAGFIQAQTNEIYFVSCGTEANNLAVRGIASAHRKRGRHVITSRVEHASVLHSCRTLESQGFEVTYLPVDRQGMVDPAQVAAALRDETILVSIMYANNEIGTLQPLSEISRLTRQRGVVFHADAVAAAGRIPIEVDRLGVDALSLASNQIYGPEGAAALYIRRGVRLDPLLQGGVQEGGRRAGSENVMAIAGFGLAAEIASEELSLWQRRLTQYQGHLAQGLMERLERVVFTGHPVHRLAGHVSLCLEFTEGEALVHALSRRGVAAATGSACRDYTTRKISHVLEAIGLDIRLAQGSLVFSIGKNNTLEEIEYVLEVLPLIVERQRSISPVYVQTVRSQG